jgi:glutamate-1-semialdehyde 2,1-aminomutase
MTTLGKYLGGSLAFGALGGRRDIMAVFDPRSPNALPHSGTFNNNTVTMRAGYAGLKHVYTPQVAKELNARGDATMQKLRAASEGTQLCFTGRGSLICSHFTADGSSSQIRSIADLKENETLKASGWLGGVRWRLVSVFLRLSWIGLWTALSSSWLVTGMRWR